MISHVSDPLPGSDDPELLATNRLRNDLLKRGESPDQAYDKRSRPVKRHSTTLHVNTSFFITRIKEFVSRLLFLHDIDVCELLF